MAIESLPRSRSADEVAASELEVHDPATGAAIARVADLGPADALRAADVAAAVAPSWAATAPRARSDVLMRAFGLMVDRRADLAELISRENGKPAPDALAEVLYAAEYLRWYAEEAVRIGGRYSEAPAGGSRIEVAYRPIGVALLVTPWNFPAAMVTRKIAPALAAGCTALLKPAAETPLTALAIADLLVEAGVPAGAFAVLPTTDPGPMVDAVLDHQSVRKLSFTGSTVVGRHLLRRAADRVQNCSMELGGNAPFVVSADADIDAAVSGALSAKFRNSGQVCTAVNRFFVHSAVADDFTARLVAAVDGLPVGPATEPTSRIGPLISAAAVSRLTSAVDAAVRSGARVVNSPVDVPSRGHFLAPRLLRDVPDDAELVTQETFGPVAPILTWDDTDDLVARANATEFGLAGYVYAENSGAARTIAERLQCGMVGVNKATLSDPAAPFGGVKQSGLGREGGREGLLAFLEPHYLSVMEDRS